jgi:hypothetical protein
MAAKIPTTVKAVFDTYPIDARKTLMAMRKIILKTAAAHEEIGPLSETLKWGQPAYLTQETKSGSTVRLAYNEKTNTCDAYFHCQSRLVDAFRARYSKELNFEGNRAMKIQPGDTLADAALGDCFAMALTYHLIKNDKMAL